MIPTLCGMIIELYPLLVALFRIFKALWIEDMLSWPIFQAGLSHLDTNSPVTEYGQFESKKLDLFPERNVFYQDTP